MPKSIAIVFPIFRRDLDIREQQTIGYRYQTMFKFVHLQESHAKITCENLFGNTMEYSGPN